MKNRRILLTLLLLIFAGISVLEAKDPRSISVYQQKPDDTEAAYFTAEKFNIKADGKIDVTAALQKAINQLETEKGYGILFIPEGKYLITNTVYVPGSVRLIGYGTDPSGNHTGEKLVRLSEHPGEKQVSRKIYDLLHRRAC
jgi:hypothetical protein